MTCLISRDAGELKGIGPASLETPGVVYMAKIASVQGYECQHVFTPSLIYGCTRSEVEKGNTGESGEEKVKRERRGRKRSTPRSPEAEGMICPRRPAKMRLTGRRCRIENRINVQKTGKAFNGLLDGTKPQAQTEGLAGSGVVQLDERRSAGKGEGSD